MRLRTRLERLERHDPAAKVIGFRWDDGPVTCDGEQMTPEEFERRYPRGTLIHMVYDDEPED